MTWWTFHKSLSKPEDYNCAHPFAGVIEWSGQFVVLMTNSPHVRQASSFLPACLVCRLDLEVVTNVHGLVEQDIVTKYFKSNRTIITNQIKVIEFNDRRRLLVRIFISINCGHSLEFNVCLVYSKPSRLHLCLKRNIMRIIYHYYYHNYTRLHRSICQRILKDD